MGKMSEQQVLKKLGIEDFRHLSKEKVVQLASMLDRMDPEVAKKALEQFPEFTKTMTEMLRDYKTTIDETLKSNEKSTFAFYENCKTITDALTRQLDDPNLGFNEKMEIVAKMKEVAEMVGAKDRENKQFLAGLVAIVGGVFVAGIGFLSTLLGGNANFNLPDGDHHL